MTKEETIRFMLGLKFYDEEENTMPGDDMPRSFHVMFSDGNERDVTSVKMDVMANGALKFENLNEELVLVIAPGTWVYVEVEARDDK